MTFIPQVAHSLMSHGGNDKHDTTLQTYVAGPLGGGNDGTSRRSEDDPNLVASKTLALHHGASVRRLLPVECERLQNLPDGWTDLGGTADSKRYAALGDAVTSSVAEWIGRRMIA